MSKESLNAYQWLQKLESEQDPVCDAAQEIVEELEREICFRDTAWHDIELSSIVERIIRERLNMPVKYELD